MGRYLLNSHHWNSIRTPQKSTFSPVVCEAMHVCVVCFVGYLIWHFSEATVQILAAQDKNNSVMG